MQWCCAPCTAFLHPDQLRSYHLLLPPPPQSNIDNINQWLASIEPPVSAFSCHLAHEVHACQHLLTSPRLPSQPEHGALANGQLQDNGALAAAVSHCHHLSAAPIVATSALVLLATTAADSSTNTVLPHSCLPSQQAGGLANGQLLGVNQNGFATVGAAAASPILPTLTQATLTVVAHPFMPLTTQSDEQLVNAQFQTMIINNPGGNMASAGGLLSLAASWLLSR